MDFAGIRQWLTSGAREADDMLALTDELMARLRGIGLEFSRFSVGFETLHPEVAAIAFFWSEGMPAIEMREISLATQISADYLVSPVRVVHEGGDMVRCRLEGDDPDLDYAFLEGLMADGFTDYVMLGVPLPGRRFAPLTLATKARGGFSDDAIAGLRGIRDLLGLHCEIHSGKHIARSLLDVYLGHGTGERVLAGGIRRGSVQRYPAAVFFCDLRQFTALSEKLPRNFIVHVLNDYFGEVGRAIDDNGGEILKFVGDAALAIFPVGEESPREACDRALTAARDLLGNMAALNERRAGEGKAPLGVGLGLHVGEVWYGNIGAANRLDFTVIGPAVNRAARLEKLASDLGETIIASSDFAEAASAAFEPVGAFELKGIEGRTRAFRPA